MTASWKWDRQRRSYGNYGNANQWTVNTGLPSLARESAQNSNDARLKDQQGELVYTFTRLTGEKRSAFSEAAAWPELAAHLAEMAKESEGAVAAGQIRAGLDALKGAEALMVLSVADYNCVGLTGPEFTDDVTNTEHFGNFIKLCRLDLFSGKEKGSGGSFGLGKAVYWRFSRLQTVIFNSTLRTEDAVGGNYRNRLLGVNQGVMHRLGEHGYEGRGFFGSDNGEDIESVWADDDLAESLLVRRDDDRPGTTALLLGFYDPDEPEKALGPIDDLVEMAARLREGIEHDFWPLLTRQRMKVRIRVVDNGAMISDELIDPRARYTELVNALERYDSGTVDDKLDAPMSVVVRDVPIKVSQRRTGDDPHAAFLHTAKLVVTLSDEVADTLENKVCLLRRPEMVVQTVERAFEGRTYHAFLLAGVAIDPDAPSTEQLRADDFLRFAEPPAHDRWIPGAASQANLTAHYVAPWLANLRDIEIKIKDELLELFGEPPGAADKPPEAIFKHLKFLRAEPGDGGKGPGAPRRPLVEAIDWKVVDGTWQISCRVTAKNRPEGWSLEPTLALVGLDGSQAVVAWAELEHTGGDGRLEGQRIILPAKDRGRTVTAELRGTSVAQLPIPAAESAFELLSRNVGISTSSSGGATT